MSIIASTFNTGTGLSSSVTNEGTLPIVVDDLTVNGNLLVIGTTDLKGQTTIDNNLIVSGVTFTEDILNNNNLIVLGGVGQNGMNTFKLPPTNGTTDQILTITDDTANPILTEWKDAATPINDYVQYDPLTEVFKRNFNLVITQINNLNLDYLNVASDLSVLGLTELGPTTINDNLTVAEITTTDNLVVNNNSIFKNGIGQTSTTQFKLPINAPGPNYRLSILDPLANPITTQWQAGAPIINEYIKQDGETLGLKNVISGIESPIYDLTVRNIGYDILKLFKLPTNTPTTGQLLSITDATTSPPTTSWIDFGVIFPDYVSYDNLNEKLINNALSTYNIDYLNLQQLKVNVLGQIGQLFTLPTNTSTATAGQVLSITNATTKSTEWVTPSAVTDYTSYNTTTKVLINNVSGTPTNITDIAVTKIGATNAQIFSLPTNTSTAVAGHILSILNGTSKTTQWIAQSAPVTNYASYNTTSKVLINNVSGTPTDITDLTVTKIGATNAQIFSLPTNTSSVSAGQILSILNASTKTTQWVNAPPTITDYTSYDTTGAGFTNNLNGTPTSITNIATQNIGYTLSQKFTLPVNTSTATIGQILSISVISPNKQTQWINAPPTITNYMSYNTETTEIINNVSGTPTTISGLNIGPLTCTTINTQNSTISCGGGDVSAGTITASVNLVSTGGLTASGLSSLTGGIIIDAANDYKFSSTGAIRGTTINGSIIGASTRLETSTINPFSPTSGFNFCNTQTGLINIGSATNRTGAINIGAGLTTGSGDVNIGSNVLSTGTQNVNINRPLTCKSIDTQSNSISSGAITCTTINTQDSTINTGTGDITTRNVLGNGADFSRLQATELNIFNTLTAGVFGTLLASITNAGALTCKGVDSGSSLIKTTGNVETSKIGATTAQLFSLPTNTSTSTTGQVLSILDGTSKTTQWITPIAPLIDYVTYNTTSNVLVNNVLGTPTNISTLVLSDTLGISYAQRFSLPANTTTASNNYVLSLSSVSFKTTQWVPAAIIPTTTETSITTAIATASAATVEMCRATNLVAGTYIITYQVEPDIATTSRAFTFRSYGVSTGTGSLINNGLVGLCVADTIPFTAPIATVTTGIRYSGSGVTVLTSTTTLYLLVRFVYTGTTFNTKGTLRATRIA
jgi:hypothetical protein